MNVDYDVPARPGRTSAQMYHDPRQATEWRDHFGDSLDADEAIAAWHAERRWRGTRSRASVAALTAAVVVGTGITAGMFGIAPLLHPGGAAHDPAAPKLAPSARTAHRHQAEYVGKHRKPASLPSRAPGSSQPAAGAQSPAGAPVAGPASARTSAPAPGTSQRSHANPPPSSSRGTGSGGSGHHVTHGGGHQGLLGGILGGVTGLAAGL